jgi:hypothetical protein
VASDSDDDGPPPPPPPRMDSLKKQNGTPIDRPLPNIPKSVSLNEFTYEGDSDEVRGRGFLPTGDFRRNVKVQSGVTFSGKCGVAAFR